MIARALARQRPTHTSNLFATICVRLPLLTTRRARATLFLLGVSHLGHFSFGARACLANGLAGPVRASTATRITLIEMITKRKRRRPTSARHSHAQPVRWLWLLA